MTSLANRVKEVQKFEQILGRMCPEQILLIRAPSGYGKSKLLDRFTQVCQNRSEIKLVKLELEDSAKGITYFISRIQRKLRRERFPTYDRALRQFLTMQNIEMSDIEIAGNENTLQIALNTDEQQKQYRLEQIEDAFFKDLGQIHGTVTVMMDSFEKAPDELQKWIRGVFLPEVAEQLKQFRVVIAGQKVPESSSEWRLSHHCCELDLIAEKEVWYEYVKAQKLNVTEEMIFALVCALKGNPRDIAEACRGIHENLS
jgi:energy-coupling factor transporter ATP-binding protein EcfA2